ncbi:exosortase-associated EpsI family protein (plasmid) [Singulisphaera sp. Ch08]|uniref:Exosortase-associated EpsI family protein n=1 Tax=Singulisphaera sp. Ch08 TaxID=3120278 RepID=A0AAU7CT41_9BACT
MSTINVSVEPNQASPVSPAAEAGSKSGLARWGRVALACIVLTISGGVRWWQVRQVEAVLRDGRIAPFPLDDLPLVLGDWRGEETKIDPKIARRTGATDLITRRYVDQRTGATLEAIILYGPSTEVYGHTPEVCYQAAGYEKVAGPDARTIDVGSLPVPFRALVYSKGEGGQSELHEVYYSWRFARHWSPDVIGTYKRFERIPGMLKIHLARLVTEHERRDIGNPCEAFLEVLLPEVERRLAATMPAAEPSRKGTAR